MKKQKLPSRFLKTAVLGILVVSSTLFSCKDHVKNYILSARHIDQTSETGVLDVNIDSLGSIIKLENREFFFVFSNPGCPACEVFEPILSRYVAQNNILVYRLQNVFGIDKVNEFNSLTNRYDEMPFSLVSDVLPPVTTTPRFSVFRDGRRLYDLPFKSTYNESAFKASMSAYYEMGYTNIVSGFLNFLSVILNEKKFIVSVYDSKNVGELDSINSQIIGLSNEKKQNSYFIDLDLFRGQDLTITSGPLEGISLSENTIITKKENNVQVSDYTDSNIVNKIKNFF